MKNNLKTLLLLTATALLTACQGAGDSKKDDPTPDPIPETKYVDVGFYAACGRINDIVNTVAGNNYTSYYYNSMKGQITTDELSITEDTKTATYQKATISYVIDVEKQISMVNCSMSFTQYSNYGTAEQTSNLITDMNMTNYYFADYEKGIVCYTTKTGAAPTTSVLYTPQECYEYWDYGPVGNTYYELIYGAALKDVADQTDGIIFFSCGSLFQNSSEEEKLFDITDETDSSEMNNKYEIANTLGTLRFEINGKTVDDNGTSREESIGFAKADFTNYLLNESSVTYTGKIYNISDIENPVLKSSMSSSVTIKNEIVEETDLVLPEME